MSITRMFFAILLALASGPALSSRGLAQEPEGAVPLAHAAAHPPHAALLTPRAKKHPRLHLAAHAKQDATVGLATPAQPAKPEPEAGQRPGVAAVPAEAHPPVLVQQPAGETPAIPAEVVQFCTNNAATAGQARIAWEAAKLKDLEARLRQKIGELEAKRAEYEEWLRRRDEALKKAEENIVAIYMRMRPDAAALQLAAMDDDMAAAVLSKLKPSNASAILNEMDPGRAARLTAAMVGSYPPADGKKT